MSRNQLIQKFKLIGEGRGIGKIGSVDGFARTRNSYELLDILQKKGFTAEPTKYVLCNVLNSCAKTMNWSLGLQVHSLLVRIGHDSNLILNSALVDFYAKCDAIDDARIVFDGMKEHDHVSWTSIISGYAQNGVRFRAVSMFKKMLATHIKPNCFTYVSIISACTGLDESLDHCTLFHCHVIKLGFDVNSFVAGSLIDSYSRRGRVEDALSVFNAAGARDNILCNSMITGYCQNQYGEDGLKLFVTMRNDGLNPTEFTVSTILNAIGKLAILPFGRQLHCLVMKSGWMTNVFVVSALIDMYSKCGNIDEARCVFGQTTEKNTITWTAIVSGYAQCGRASEALELFDHMVEKEGLSPDHVSFTAILNTCNHAGYVDKALEYFENLRKDYDLTPTPDHYACLIDLYSRKGHLIKAKEIMDEMPFDPNYVMLSSFLSCCRTYGDVELGRWSADRLFDMQADNAAAYITMAQIYAEAEMWNNVGEIRELMNWKRAKKSAGWSWFG